MTKVRPKVVALDWRRSVGFAALVLMGCSQPATERAAPRVSASAVNTTSKTTPVATSRPVDLNAQPNTVAEYLSRAQALRAAYSQPAQRWPKPTLDEGVEHREIGRLPEPVFPADNLYSKEKEALGRQLFFDPRLSGSGQIACASCHDPDLAWADGRTVSFGHNRSALKRNAPSIQFAAYAKFLFWDGRAASLEEQFHGPVESAHEMAGSADVIIKRLSAVPEYRDQFRRVFGADEITMVDASKAVATFERSIAKLAGRSKFDKFLAGETKMLSDEAVRGLHLFRTSARCLNCHNGPTFSDDQFHDLGLSYFGRSLQDLGRYEITRQPTDVGRFKTPTLRNVGRTRPYMHNGLFELTGLINAYNNGMPRVGAAAATQKNNPLYPVKDKLLKPLGLGALERADLLAFLQSLDEPPLRIRPPNLPGMDAATAIDASVDLDNGK